LLPRCRRENAGASKKSGDIAARQAYRRRDWYAGREKPQLIATIRTAPLIVVKGALRHGFALDS
jgi:hypothetical protein